MPEVKDSEGNVIANLPYTDEGMEQAKDMKEANPNLNVDYSPGGMTDGAARSVTEYAGGGKTGYSAIGAERPMYKEGGKVKKKASKKKYDEEGRGEQLDKYDKNVGKAKKHMRLSELEKEVSGEAFEARTGRKKSPGIHRPLVEEVGEEIPEVTWKKYGSSEKSKKEIKRIIMAKKKKLGKRHQK